MKYTIVYREDPRGYNWTVRNVHNQYAACQWAGGNVSIRSWRTAAAAADYMDVYRHRNHPQDLVWAPWPEENPTAIKPVTTAASYKPAHGGYPTSAPRCVGHELDRMAAGWASMGAVTGRIPSSQPLVWPVIPQADDGSNEEATTVPDSLVQLMAHRVFIVRLRNALTK